jgi:methionyl-tRNA formyltransferase
MTIRVLFFGNSQSTFSNRLFKALLETAGELAGVVDAPPEKRTSTIPGASEDPSFVKVARSRSIPAFEPSSPNQAGFVDQAGDLAPDLLLCIGYPCILKEDILSVPRLLAANFHASLLPRYRGKHPVFWALRNGERWAGLTVHKMDPGIDTGDILYQVRLRTCQRDTVETLYHRIIDRSLVLVGRLIADLARGTAIGHQQPPEAGSYYSSITEADYHLDLFCPAETLRRWISTTPGECYLDIADQRYFIRAAGVLTMQSAGRMPGVIASLGKRSGTIATGKDGLVIRQLWTANGEIISFASLCKRLGLVEGDSLPVNRI